MKPGYRASGSSGRGTQRGAHLGVLLGRVQDIGRKLRREQIDELVRQLNNADRFSVQLGFDDEVLDVLLCNPRNEVVCRLLNGEGRVLEETEELRESENSANDRKGRTPPGTCLVKRVAHDKQLRRDIAHEARHNLEDSESRTVPLARICDGSARVAK